MKFVRFFISELDLIPRTMAGTSQVPNTVVITKPKSVAQYSDGNAGRSSLKFAVKLPNFVMLIVASGLSPFKFKKSKIESQADEEEEVFSSIVAFILIGLGVYILTESFDF